MDEPTPRLLHPSLGTVRQSASAEELVKARASLYRSAAFALSVGTLVAAAAAVVWMVR